MLQKYFWGDDQKSSGLLMRFARGDMRGHRAFVVYQIWDKISRFVNNITFPTGDRM
jgi:hypothetical protein